MIDFDALFTKYILEWHKQNSARFTPDEIEGMVDQIYNEWSTTSAKELGGLSPKQYFEKMKTSELVAALKEYDLKQMSTPSLLSEELADRPDSETHLLSLIREKKAGALTVTAVNLLVEMQSKELSPELAQWILDSEVEAELRGLAAETLANEPQQYAEVLLGGIDLTDTLGKELAADVLVNIPQNDRIYDLLMELFKTGDNIPLYASYLGRYGNPDAISALTDTIDTANYMEFLELASAIERLGGTVDYDGRDWSGDYYYEALKGVK